MKKSRRWHRLWVIILSLIILPLAPLGLLMLWLSPRTLRMKVTITGIFVLLLAGASIAVVRTDAYGRFTTPEVPPAGYDVTLNNRNEYRTKTIFPFERDIFSAVVQEMRKIQPEHIVGQEEIISLDMVRPEVKAFEIVADEYGLDYETVEAIYMKVSSQLIRPGK